MDDFTIVIISVFLFSFFHTPKIAGRCKAISDLPLGLKLLFALEAISIITFSYYIPTKVTYYLTKFQNPFVPLCIIGIAGTTIFAAVTTYFINETKREEAINKMLEHDEIER